MLGNSWRQVGLEIFLEREMSKEALISKKDFRSFRISSVVRVATTHEKELKSQMAIGRAHKEID